MYLLKYPINLSSYLGIRTRICIKPASVDKWVSSHIRKSGAHSPKMVNTVLKMVQLFPEATFLGLPFFYIHRFAQYEIIWQMLDQTLVCSALLWPPWTGVWWPWMLYQSIWPTSGNHWASGVTVRMLEQSTMQWGEWMLRSCIISYIKVTIWENLHFPIQLYIIFIKSFQW